MQSRLKRLIDSWNFTPAERAVVLTLAGAFILGLGIRVFRSGAAPSPVFDYAALDAEFAERSVGPGTGAPAPSGADPISPASGPAGVNPSSGKALRVELNRASKADLMRLPGIGEVIAGRILRYREEHGAFGSVRDLMKVRGIGAKKFGKIAPHCTVEN